MLLSPSMAMATLKDYWLTGLATISMDRRDIMIRGGDIELNPGPTPNHINRDKDTLSCFICCTPVHLTSSLAIVLSEFGGKFVWIYSSCYTNWGLTTVNLKGKL